MPIACLEPFRELLGEARVLIRICIAVFVSNRYQQKTQFEPGAASKNSIDSSATNKFPRLINQFTLYDPNSETAECHR